MSNKARYRNGQGRLVASAEERRPNHGRQANGLKSICRPGKLIRKTTNGEQATDTVRWAGNAWTKRRRAELTDASQTAIL